MNRSTNQKKHQSGQSSSKFRKWKIKPSIRLGTSLGLLHQGEIWSLQILRLMCCRWLVAFLRLQSSFQFHLGQKLEWHQNLCSHAKLYSTYCGQTSNPCHVFQKNPGDPGDWCDIQWSPDNDSPVRSQARKVRSLAKWSRAALSLLGTCHWMFPRMFLLSCWGKWHGKNLGKIWDAKMARPSHHPCMFCQIICPLKLLPVRKHLKNAQRDVHRSMTGQPNNWT